LLRLLKKKPIVYLRSDGYGEYKAILGFFGPIIYHLMFIIVSNISSLVSCRKYILRGKSGEIVSPSQLSPNWLANIKEPDLDKIKLLYVGRIRKEKGIFSLLELVKKIKIELTLTIVGAEKGFNNSISENNINFFNVESNEEKLIEYYDNHNIFILPSFTEGHPMALLESLSRLRPVIIFKDIEHVIEDKKGIFVAERNSESLLEKIEFIKKNYSSIQEEMKKNYLPTKQDFLRDLSSIISKIN
jgi:glycosyltransferase involved in cell wall biosynthesis